MIELTDNSPQAAAQKIAAEANARIVELCRRAYQKGVNEGKIVTLIIDEAQKLKAKAKAVAKKL